jgi:hypothetical protein
MGPSRDSSRRYGLVDEEFEQEMYEEPDYNVWETNRVYEDMALEREEAEAEALAEALEAEVRAVVEGVASALPGMPLDIIERIAERILIFQHDRKAAQEAEDEAEVERSRSEPWWVGRRDRDQLTGAYIAGTERQDPLTGEWQ